MSELKRISNNYVPKFTNFEKLKEMYGCDENFPPYALKENTKEEAWADMPKEAVEYLRSLDEFDADIFYNVTGIKTKDL